MPCASAIRSPETGYGQFKHFIKLPGYLTFLFSLRGNCNRPYHLGIDGEIIDMPVKGLFLSAVAFKSCRKVPLSTSSIEIYSLVKIEPS